MSHAHARSVVTPLETGARRHRRAVATPSVLAETAAFADEEAEASTLINLLCDALEKIVAQTTDERARAIATEAMSEFYGR